MTKKSSNRIMAHNENYGGTRRGAGRPETDRKKMLGVRLSQEAFEKLCRLTKNKSEYIDELIKQQSE